MEFYPEIGGTDTALVCSPWNQCPPPWQQQGWKASSPTWATKCPKGWGHRWEFFFRNLHGNNLTELEMDAPISTQRGKSHSESF